MEYGAAQPGLSGQAEPTSTVKRVERENTYFTGSDIVSHIFLYIRQALEMKESSPAHNVL